MYYLFIIGAALTLIIPVMSIICSKKMYLRIGGVVGFIICLFVFIQIIRLFERSISEGEEIAWSNSAAVVITYNKEQSKAELIDVLRGLGKTEYEIDSTFQYLYQIRMNQLD